MAKVSVFDRRIVGLFLKLTSALSATLSIVVIFVDLPTELKTNLGWGFLGVLVISYIAIWRWADNLNSININIEGSRVAIKVGDIFLEPGLKAIGFNEYFDTLVDNTLIAEESLNGIFINKHLDVATADLDRHIQSYSFQPGEELGVNSTRASGKTVRYQVGTICVYDTFLLTAFAKFDEQNKATLTMPEYLEFLITFWDNVNRVYGQRSVTTPIFGSGITRITGHRTISDEDLLKIMLWTFRVSEMRFKYPAQLTILVHQSKIDKVNLLDIKSAWNGV